MSHVPSELHREILLRLPAESLFRFRSVCKAWLRIMEDPSFVKAHNKHQHYSHSHSHSHTLLVRNESGDPLYSFSLDSLNFTKGPQMIDATPITQIKYPILIPDLFSTVSSNGLILIPQHKWTIWNPLTGECHELPHPSAASGLKCVEFGLGYDPVTDDYKVVRIYNKLLTLIYSLKSNSWSMIQPCPWDPRNPRATFWNGAWYWTSSGRVLALDLATERYYQLPLPPLKINIEYLITNTKPCEIHIEALDGCLIFCLDYNNLFDGWILKHKSWIKLFSLPYPVDNMSWRLRLVAYLSGKHQVVVQHDSGFWWFDIVNNSVLKFSTPHLHSSVVCPGSLVRLKRPSGLGVVSAEETLTRKGKRETEIPSKRLDFLVEDA